MIANWILTTCALYFWSNLVNSELEFNVIQIKEPCVYSDAPHFESQGASWLIWED